MSVRVKPFPEFGVGLNIYSGTPTPDDIYRFAAELQRVEGARWLNYLDPTLDISGLDIAHIPMIKHVLAERLRALYGETPVRAAMVTASPANALLLDFWPRYVGRDVDYPTEAVAFPNLDAACAWLGLTEQACRAVAEAIAGA
jgi:hypothetical protein